MPDSKPSNAPDQVPDRAREDTTAAAVLSDADMDKTPGGGGLGGAAAADAIAGSKHASQGATPNTPAGAAVSPPQIAGQAAAPGEARVTDDAKLGDAGAGTDDPYPSERP